jgi:hypothetical protein
MTCEATLRRLRDDDINQLLGLYAHLQPDDLPEVAPGARAAAWNAILEDDSQRYLGAFVGRPPDHDEGAAPRSPASTTRGRTTVSRT